MNARSRAPYQLSAEDITQWTKDYEDSASETSTDNCEPSGSQKQNWPRLPPDSVKRMASMEKTVTDYRNSSRVPEPRWNSPTPDAHRSGKEADYEEDTVTDYSNRSRYEQPYPERHDVAAQEQTWPGRAVYVNPRSWELTEPMPEEHRQHIMGHRRGASKSERNHIVSKSGYMPRSTHYPTDIQGIPRQTSGRGSDNYRQQSEPKTKYCIKVPSVSSYDQQQVASYESRYQPQPRNERDSLAQTYCDPCNAPAPKSLREQKPCEVCQRSTSSKQRREPYYEYYDEPPPTPRSQPHPQNCDECCKRNRNKSRQHGYNEPQPKLQSPYSSELQPPPGMYPNEAPSCSSKQKQSKCPASVDNMDYMEDRERQQKTYHNPIVVKSTVCIPQQPPKSKSPETCPAYRNRSPKMQVSCECGPPVRPKPKIEYLPRPEREFCTNSTPSDYVAHQRGSGLFNRNPLTPSNCDDKIHSCGRPQPPELSREAMNKRKVKGQNYSGAGRGNAPREPLRASPSVPPKNPSQHTACKCKPCNKPQSSRPKKAPAAKNPSLYYTPQLQQGPTEADHSLYVPPSCFAPTNCPAKKKRTAADSKRGRSSSGFTVKPTISIHKTRRKLKAANSLVNNRWQCPKCTAQRQNVLRKPSGLCGAEVKNRSKAMPAKVRQLGSKLITGSGYNMIPFPTLTRLNLNRRIPRLTPTYPHRCQGGKLNPTSTRVVKTRHKVNQNENSMNSMVTARSTARRGATETRRHQPQSQAQAPAPSYRGTKATSTTVRRDLPPRYQPPIQTTHRPVQVTEEAARPSPRRSQIVGSNSQMTRQSNLKSSSQPQRTERSASRVHSEKKTVSIRQANPGNPPESGHSLSSRSTNSRPAAHDIPHRVQEGSKSPTPSKPRSHLIAVPRVPSEDREPTDRSRTPTPEHPHFSGPAQAQEQPVFDSRAQQFYRGSFLTIRPTLSNEPVIRAPPRPRGSLIMIAQKGLTQQVLKRAIPKGSSFIVPNKWQCMGKMNGFLGTNRAMGTNSAIPQRPYSNWRKIIHWFLHGKYSPT